MSRTDKTRPHLQMEKTGMDAWFVGFIIAVVLAAIVFLISTFVEKERIEKQSYRNDLKIYPRKAVHRIGFGLVGLGIGLFLMSTWVIVGTNQVGIFTSMGRPYDATDNGWEWKAPWAMKTEFDGARQFLRFCQDGNNEADADKKLYRRVSIKIDGNAKADICGVVAWQMKATTEEEKKNAIQLFKDYRTFERVTNNLVYSNLKVAIASALASLNPLVPEKNLTVAQINEKILLELKNQFNDSIIVQAADIAVPDYDDKTDEAIAADLAQKAKTSLEKEKELTNRAASAANAAIVNSIQDEKVLINKCLDIAKELGYNPGLCMMSGGQGVLLDGSALNKKP